MDPLPDPLPGEREKTAPLIHLEGDRIVARCSDGRSLAILEAELDGEPLTAIHFEQRFGRAGVRPGETQ
jgi:hypothetical protein